MTERLSTSIAGQRYENPVWLGSGTLGQTMQRVQSLLSSEAGAIIPRTTRLHLAKGRNINPSPHLDIDSKTHAMRNAEWTGETIEYWRPYLQELQKTRRIVMSISGRDVPGCVTTCKELDSYHFPLLEVNISCAHSNEQNGFITRDSEHIRNVIAGIKDAGVVTPISIKLGHSDHIVQLAQMAEEAGANAITAINSYGPVLDFDISDGKPELTLGISGGKGGLSGRPIFPIALTDVADLARHIHIPIIACGGVEKAEDVIKMIMAGASAVQVYTAAHLQGIHAPKYLSQLVADVETWMQKNKYKSIDDIQGMVLPQLSSGHVMDKQIPSIQPNMCNGCKKCEPICLEEAIHVDERNNPKIDSDACIGCGACVTVCPTAALDYK